MSTRTVGFDPVFSDYVRNAAMPREGDVLARLRAVTAKMPKAQMQISVEQGRLMAMMVQMLGAKRAIEVGTFTGYSALCVAQQLPPAPVGRLVACDVSDEWTSVGKPFWREAGVADRIDLRLGPASGTLAAMIDAGEAGTYDFAFIDADKEAYDGYYEQCLTLLRPGGVVTLDNIFMNGSALAPKPGEAGPNAVHALTKKIVADRRVDSSLIPIGDGLLAARKR